jgi:hypothetical protein
VLAELGQPKTTTNRRTKKTALSYRVISNAKKLWMAYSVKWTATNPTRTMAYPTRFARASEAVECACGVLHENPPDIWVEDEHWHHIADRNKIASYCRGEINLTFPSKSAT